MSLDVAPRFSYRRSLLRAAQPPTLADTFGVRSVSQVARDYLEMARDGLRGARFQADLTSTGLLRPDLSWPAYAGLVPSDRLAPVFMLFDRVGGGRRYTQRVSRRTAKDFRGGRLSYDEHDGTDLVCPVGTPLSAAAPGTVVMIRDRWLRGGLTVAIDHGHGVVTQYTHCSRSLLALGSVVKRGDVLALSGAAGVEMTGFFPWVPPHVHFLVQVNGVAVDPFLAPGQAPGSGTWLTPEQPAPSGPLREDGVAPKVSAIDRDAMAYAVAACTDARIRRELEAARAVPEQLAALLEDALAHDPWAFAEKALGTCVRPVQDGPSREIRLTLPLPAQAYAGIRFADAPWTVPPRAANRNMGVAR